RGLRGIGSRGDALADFAEACDELRDVTVLRVVRHTTQVPDEIVWIRRICDAASSPDVLDNRTVALLRPRTGEQTIRDDAALQRFILVMVRGDEARHDDCSGAVDYFRVACRDRWGDFGNSLPIDQDVGLFKVAHPRVEAQHDTAAQDNSA